MNLEEALKLYDKAKVQGLVGEWPKALIVVVEEMHNLSAQLYAEQTLNSMTLRNF